MARFLLPVLVLIAFPAAATDGSEIALPSGQKVTWIDTINDAPGPEGLTMRFRFLAPAIARDGGTVGVEAAQEDMQVLCDAFALPRLSVTGPQPSQIIITLSDRPTEFGVPDPEATQYFEAYSIENGACIWEVF